MNSLNQAQLEYMYALGAKRELVSKLETLKQAIGAAHLKVVNAQAALPAQELAAVQAHMLSGGKA